MGLCVCICSFSHVQLFATPWTSACQASLSTSGCERKNHESYSQALMASAFLNPHFLPLLSLIQLLEKFASHFILLPGFCSLLQRYLCFCLSLFCKCCQLKQMPMLKDKRESVEKDIVKVPAVVQDTTAAAAERVTV